MAAFTYDALAGDGRTLSGRIEADDVLAAQRALEGKGLVPIAVRSAVASGSRAARVPAGQVLLFARSLGGLLAAGVPLSRALAVLENEATHPGARAAWSGIHARIRDGAGLAEAMAAQPGLFPPVFLAMVRAGEAGGFLGVVLDQVADYLEKSRELIGRVTSALVYPCLLAFIASAVVSFLLVWFIPRFATLFASFHRDLPAITQLIQQASWFLVHYGWLLVLLIAGAVVGGRAVLAQPAGAAAWERLQLRIPVLSTIIATLARVRFCRMLGTLLAAGVPLLAALKVSREAVGSGVLASALADATEAIRQGTALSTALRREPGHPLAAMLPATALEVLAVAESSGHLPKELLRLADTSERDLDRHLRTAVSLAEPLLLLLMAAIVGTIVVGMLMPIFDLWSAIS
jgi:type II secretory pathway component PulF